MVFAGVLLSYFWTSAWTKIGAGASGFVNPSIGAYAQIVPRALEAADFDTSQLRSLDYLIVLAGTWAEFLLPACIVLGLATRLAALALAVFVIVQSATDIYGHGVSPATVGVWFDHASDGLIADQRALWLFLLTVLFFKGGGPLSFDRFFRRSSLPSKKN